MNEKAKLPGVKIYKSFNAFIKKLSKDLEKKHNLIHTDNKKQLKKLAESQQKG